MITEISAKLLFYASISKKQNLYNFVVKTESKQQNYETSHFIIYEHIGKYSYGTNTKNALRF